PWAEGPRECGFLVGDTIAECTRASFLHVRVIRSAGALRYHPIDVLLRVLNVAGFAMDAILRVDLQPLLAAPGLLDDLVYPGRTIALLRRVVEPIIDLDRLCRVAQLQMR